MPVDGRADPVDVLLELPGQAALTDPRGSGDRDQARLAIPGRGPDQVLEQPELLVPADERRLGQVRAALAAALADDSEGPIRRDRRLLALERLLARLLERDRGTRGAHRGFAHEHGSGLGD